MKNEILAYIESLKYFNKARERVEYNKIKVKEALEKENYYKNTKICIPAKPVYTPIRDTLGSIEHRSVHSIEFKEGKLVNIETIMVVE